MPATGSSQTPKPTVLRAPWSASVNRCTRFDSQRWLAKNLSDVAFPGGSTPIDTWEGFDRVLRVFEAEGGTVPPTWWPMTRTRRAGPCPRA